MKTLPVALQVFSVRDDAEKDFKGTMQRVKEMGYDGVELAGLYGHTAEQIAKCWTKWESELFPRTFPTWI
ncbi:MAG: hypothetical protein ACLTXL_07250 [Clostridia bacterium]